MLVSRNENTINVKLRAEVLAKDRIVDGKLSTEIVHIYLPLNLNLMHSYYNCRRLEALPT